MEKSMKTVLAIALIGCFAFGLMFWGDVNQAEGVKQLKTPPIAVSVPFTVDPGEMVRIMIHNPSNQIVQYDYQIMDAITGENLSGNVEILQPREGITLNYDPDVLYLYVKITAFGDGSLPWLPLANIELLDTASGSVRRYVPVNHIGLEVGGVIF